MQTKENIMNEKDQVENRKMISRLLFFGVVIILSILIAFQFFKIARLQNQLIEADIQLQNQITGLQYQFVELDMHLQSQITGLQNQFAELDLQLQSQISNLHSQLYYVAQVAENADRYAHSHY